MEQVMTRCMVKTICMKKWNRLSAANHQEKKIFFSWFFGIFFAKNPKKAKKLNKFYIKMSD